MKRWNADYEKAMKMAKSGRGSIFERVSLLAKVYENPQFKKDMEAAGKVSGVVLNDAVEDTFASFSELYAMLKAFPSRDQWSAGSLPEMRESLRSSLEEKEKRLKKENEVDKNSRKLSWKDKYLALEGKYKELEARHRQLVKDYRELQKSLSPRRAS